MTTLSIYLLLAAVFSGAAGYLGLRAVSVGRTTFWTMAWMVLSFITQCLALGVRGEMRGQCPLGDFGEILIFLAWSMTLFYLIIGSNYRLSLLGVFSAPIISGMLLVPLIPGVMDPFPVRAKSIDPWNEAHAALSVLAYGALGLAAVAGVMFMVLNRKLKEGEIKSGLFRQLPSLSFITASMVRLAGVGTLCLSAGLLCGFLMSGKTAAGWMHLWVAIGVWGAYVALLFIWFVKGMTPLNMAVRLVLLFIASLLVFVAL